MQPCQDKIKRPLVHTDVLRLGLNGVCCDVNVKPCMSYKVCAQNSHEVPYFHRALGKQDVLEPWILQSTYLYVLSSCLFSLLRQMYAVLITSYYSISCTLSIESAHSVCLCIDAVEGPML